MVDFIPLNPAFGAELRGLDLRHPLSSEQAAELRQGLDKYKLIVARAQSDLSSDRQIEVMGLFGNVMDEQLDGNRFLFITTKRGETGAAPGYRRIRWHSDSAATPWPVPVISLYGAEVRGNVAPTFFVSGVRAWEALPSELKSRLSDKTCLNMVDMTPGVAPYTPVNYRPGDQLDPVHFPHAWHPVRKEHPRTGEPVLYVSEHNTVHIGDLSAEESAALAEELHGYLYDPAYVIRHDWREGDLVIWDNLALQHGRPATTEDSPESELPRRLRRVAVSDDWEKILDLNPLLRQRMLARR